MAALAAVYNPLAPKEESINLFFNTGNAQVALTLKNGTDGSDPNNDAWAAGDDDYPGYILNPSEIDGGSFQGVHLVVATTKPLVAAGGTVTNNQISLVSPVYKKLTTTSLVNKNVAFSSSDRGAWAYFLDGSANYQVTLKEYDFLTGSVAPYLSDADIRLNSSLAAYYNTKTKNRFVLYQELNQNNLKEYDISSGQSFDLQNSDDAAPGTTIAVTYDDEKAYVYYADSSKNIRRIIKSGDNTWSSSHRVQSASAIGVPGQLTVTTANGFNHLFYISVNNVAGNNIITHIADPIADPTA